MQNLRKIVNLIELELLNYKNNNYIKKRNNKINTYEKMNNLLNNSKNRNNIHYFSLTNRNKELKKKKKKRKKRKKRKG